MTNVTRRIALLMTISSFGLLCACGGGGSSSTKPTVKTSLPTISIISIEPTAVEQNSQVAKFKIERSSGTEQLAVSFDVTGHTDITKGSADASDYQLLYADGNIVGDSFIIPANESSRIIEVKPISDNLFEVPEQLNVNLTTQSTYQLSQEPTVSLTIIDADNTRDNAKVFYGVFTPQGDAITSATGVLSFILQGDNELGQLSYSFTNLGSEQTDQHIHLAPSGTMIKDLEGPGNVINMIWDLAPGGIFKTEQEMLDTLFNGEFFVNIHSANYPAGEISATLLYDANIKPPEQVDLTEADVDRDIIRFLNQATFGATPEDYQPLRDQINADGTNRMQVYNQWIEQQISMPASSLYDFTEAVAQHFPEEAGVNIRRDAFYNLAVHGKDQLRQRMAFALSQILVVSDEAAAIRNAHKGAAIYWDNLASNAFDYYNKALFDATLSPIMGVWLSHLYNQKEDVGAGYYPDENYAREVMQLFSFGLVHLNKNGTIALGDDNLPKPTYSNETIKEMARVFTGLSFRFKNDGENKVANNNFFLGDWANEYQYRWREPMKFFTSEHDFGSKTLFTDNNGTVTVAANNDKTDDAAMSEVAFVVDSLVAHSSTAPFISKQLIQRFVTSNPSSAYIERVANKFAEKGDLTATIKAILLDEEARNPQVHSSNSFGKIKEPIIQLTANLRLFKVKSRIALDDSVDTTFDTPIPGLNLELADKYQSGATLIRMGDLAIGQRALGANSVFNFYLPSYTPSGALASNSLMAPELQLLTEAQMFSTMNIYNGLMNSSLYRNNAAKYSIIYQNWHLKVWLQQEDFFEIWQNTSGTDTDKATAVVDYLDFYLNAGLMKANDNQGTRKLFIENLVQAASNNRFKLAFYGANTSPEFVLQK
ncbi:DUF1800 family protein [Thalassotalea nanhaiensis]|uniref:DUF1800 family protein n=1 Tax=Thalassotalea nanhaiensis TaxID=3065648 RepID=A0ABY9TLL1_9GAMM|nr:DUF1800 family protein [Colwelliaceae bacterium SQ345]